jgi:hypothetical protein
MGAGRLYYYVFRLSATDCGQIERLGQEKSEKLKIKWEKKKL